MSTTLKMIFELSDGSKSTISLADPKEGLTKTEALAAANEIVSHKVIKVDDATPSAVSDIYIQKNERVELATDN